MDGRNDVPLIGRRSAWLIKGGCVQVISIVWLIIEWRATTQSSDDRSVHRCRIIDMIIIHRHGCGCRTAGRGRRRRWTQMVKLAQANAAPRRGIERSPWQEHTRHGYSVLTTYMTVKHNMNSLMGCRHSIVLACIHDKRMIFASMKGLEEDGRINSR
jgi:hypothetical protein